MFFAPRFFSFLRADSRTMFRKSPSKGNGFSLRSMSCPVRSRPNRRDPIQSPASFWAVSQLKNHQSAPPSLLKYPGRFFTSVVLLSNCEFQCSAKRSRNPGNSRGGTGRLKMPNQGLAICAGLRISA